MNEIETQGEPGPDEQVPSEQVLAAQVSGEQAPTLSRMVAPPPYHLHPATRGQLAMLGLIALAAAMVAVGWHATMGLPLRLEGDVMVPQVAPVAPRRAPPRSVDVMVIDVTRDHRVEVVIDAMPVIELKQRVAPMPVLVPPLTVDVEIQAELTPMPMLAPKMELAPEPYE